MHVLGSFIFGLPSDRQDTFEATVALAEEADLTFAQFVLLTPFPARSISRSGRQTNRGSGTSVDGVPLTQHWLIPENQRPKLYTEHPTMSLEEIRVRTQGAWDRLLQLPPHLEAVARRRSMARACVRARVQALSADVREHRHRHRQRARSRSARRARWIGRASGACSSRRRCRSSRASAGAQRERVCNQLVNRRLAPWS